jgi:hypothetical protein
MSQNNGIGSGHSHPLEESLETIAHTIRTTAYRYQQDSRSLLALLRTLEALHREIRDELFQETLPDNRQALYALLRDIEAEGGWPYIHRMKLHALLEKMPQEVIDDHNSLP